MYLTRRPALSGCGCGCKGKGACGPVGIGDAGDGIGGFGDALIDPTQVTAQGAPAGTNPIAYLQGQINRYTAAAGAPAGYQYGDPIAVTGVLDQNTALRALVIVQRRAIEAGVADAVSRVTTAILQGPVAFVQANPAYVVDTVRIYGDLHGVPAAVGDASASLIPGVPTWALVLGAAGVAYYLWGRK